MSCMTLTSDDRPRPVRARAARTAAARRRRCDAARRAASLLPSFLPSIHTCMHICMLYVCMLRVPLSRKVVSTQSMNARPMPQAKWANALCPMPSTCSPAPRGRCLKSEAPFVPSAGTPKISTVMTLSRLIAGFAQTQFCGEHHAPHHCHGLRSVLRWAATVLVAASFTRVRGAPHGRRPARAPEDRPGRGREGCGC